MQPQVGLAADQVVAMPFCSTGPFVLSMSTVSMRMGNSGSVKVLSMAATMALRGNTSNRAGCTRSITRSRSMRCVAGR